MAFGTSTIFMIIVALAFLILFFIFWSQIQRGRNVALRLLPPLNHLRNMVEEFAERGTSVQYSPGNGGLNGQSGTAEVLNGLTTLATVERVAARTGGRVIAVTNGSLTYQVADDIAQVQYREAGREEDYNRANTRFLTQQDRTAYIAGITAISSEEQVSGNILLGRFGDEVLLAGDRAVRRDLPQVVGSTQVEALPLMIATAGLQNTLLGEEIYATPAYVDRQAPYLASLRVQDVLRVVIIAAIIVGTILATIGVPIGNLFLH